MKPTCGICCGLNRQSFSLESQPWDVTLLESEHFAAVPSRGSIVPGWVLVVSKEHVLCMGAIEAQQKLADFTNEVRSVVERSFGPTVTFEHGPATPKLRVGCGVDHAHLHIVPTSCDLLAAVPSVYPNPLIWHRVASLASVSAWYQRGESYLFMQQLDGSCWVGTHADLPSQLFRKVIAKSIGSPEQFDWKFYPNTENVKVTVNTLTSESALAVTSAR